MKMEHIWSLYAIPKFSLHVIGFWPKEKPSLAYRVRGNIAICIMTTYTILTITTFLCKDIQFRYLLDMMYHFTAYVHFNVKSIFLICYRRQIAQVLSKARNIEMHLNCRWFKIGAYTFEIGVTCAIYSQVIPAIFTYNTKSILDVMFPFNLSSKWAFMLAYLIYATSYTLIAFAIAIDVLMWALLLTCFTLIRDLREKIVAFFRDYRGTKEDARQFRAIIIRHVEIIEFSKQFSYAFEEIVLGVPLCGIFVVCFGIFNIMTVADLQQSFNAVVTSTCSLLQMYVFCHLGQHLQDLSTGIWDVVYQSDWRKCSRDVQKSLVLIAARARRPLTLNMGKFGYLSFGLFVWIVRAAMSYVVALSKLYNNR